MPQHRYLWSSHSWALGLLLLAPLPPALAQPSIPSTPGAMEKVDQWQGRWLHEGHAEVFVALKPWPRIVIFRIAGQTSPLATDAGQYSGIRTWIMAPRETATSAGISLAPAQITASGSNRLQFTAADDSATSLALSMDISLRDNPPRLRLVHRVTNHSTAPQTFSVWSIAALRKQGQVLLPLTSTVDTPARQLLLYKKTTAGEPAFTSSVNAILADVTRPTDHEIKIGTTSDRGWLAAIQGDQTLLSVAPVSPGNYPEGGATISAYISQNNASHGGWIELEHMTSLTRVAPGESLTLTRTLTLVPTPSDIFSDLSMQQLQKIADDSAPEKTKK